MSTLVSCADVVRNSFNFTVDKLRLEGPDGFKTPYYGLFKSDTNECLNAVTAKYHPHTTDDVVVLVEAAQVAFDDSVNVKCHWRNGHNVIIEPTKEHRKAIYGTADNIFPRMFVNAGYNDRPFIAGLGMHRDACLNLMRLKQVTGTSVSIRHTMSLRPRLNELIDVFSGLKENWKTVTEVVAEMENRQVSLVSFLDAVYPLAADGSASCDDPPQSHRGNRSPSAGRMLEDWPSIRGGFHDLSLDGLQLGERLCPARTACEQTGPNGSGAGFAGRRQRR